MSINRLSHLEVANAKVGMHADGGGLYLQVTRTRAGQLNKSWLFRYSVGGRERQMGLGSLTQVKLADVRQKALECRSSVATELIQSKPESALGDWPREAA